MRIQRQLCLSVFIIASVVELGATQIKDTLYINRGIFQTVDSMSFPYLAFNDSKTFTSLNKVVRVSMGDTLLLSVYNNDTARHSFDLAGLSGYRRDLNPGEWKLVMVSTTTRSIISFFDPSENRVPGFMGLSGMICVDDYSNKSIKRFYWNLKDHDSSLNQAYGRGEAVSFSGYYPNYFTINGLSHPDLQKDSAAVVKGFVGDTIRIFCLNSGKSAHSIHFHGFHTKAVYHNRSLLLNWDKDTWGMVSGDAIVMEFIPDKVGLYSVHDHNLVAVSGGGIHPNGMFLIMEIK